MKTRVAGAAVAALIVLTIPCARGQGTAFGYQGQLNAGGGPAHGFYDFRFKLAADSLGASSVGAPYLTNDIGVSNGIFNVAIDFGADVFNGSNYWLEIDVRTNGGGTYVALSPLQPILPAPYAIFANTASNLSGTVPADQLTGAIGNASLPANPSFSGTVKAGAFAGSGAALTNLNPAELAPGTAAISISGNAGTATSALTANSANTAGALSGTLPATQLSGTLANSLFPASPTFSGAVDGGSFVGNGATLTNLNPTNIAAGTAAINISGNAATATSALTANSAVTAASAATAATASALTGALPATQLTGTIANGALPASPSFSGTIQGGSFVGNGGSLTNLNPANLGSGTAAINISGTAATATAALSANTANSATTAGTAASFSGALSGDVVGTQGATTVAQVGGQTAAFVASGALSASMLLSTNNAGSFFAGQLAGASNLTATGNTGVGSHALWLSTNGHWNTAVGYFALAFDQSGSENTAVGENALYSNDTGSNNTAVGRLALGSDTEGAGNTAIGAGAGLYGVGGSNNTAAGFQALRNATNETYDIALGYQAGYAFNRSESSNIDIGNAGVRGDNFTIRIGDDAIHTKTYLAGVINGNGAGLTNLVSTQLAANPYGSMLVGPAGNPVSAGYFNTALGYQAFVSDTSGYNNVAIGTSALADNTTGSGNTAMGYAALFYDTTGGANVAVGQGALEVSTVGSNNVALGDYSLHLSADGSYNTGVGSYSFSGFGNAGSGGASNIAIGYMAAKNLGGAENNDIDIGNNGVKNESGVIRIGIAGLQTATFIAGVITGNGAGLTNLALPIGPNGNFFVGPAGNATGTGADNTGLGGSALESDTTGSLNLALGGFALSANTTGSDNLAAGYGALLANTSGLQNLALGINALAGNTTGNNNVALGPFAIKSNQMGSGNVGVGYQTLNDFGASGSGGGNNIAVGTLAGSQLGGAENNDIDIGNDGVKNESGVIRIGIAGLQTATFIAGAMTGNGAGLTNLSATSLLTGVISTNALPGFQGPDFQVIGGGLENTNNGYIGTIAGGQNNAIYAVQGVLYQGAIGGGYGNIVSNSYATIAGGSLNVAGGEVSTVAGGLYNNATGAGAFIGGGGYDGSLTYGNTASGMASVIGGGEDNVAGDFAVVGGGFVNTATGAGSFIGGGGWDGATIYASEATGAGSVIGGGLGNTNQGRTATIGGGANNLAKGANAFVGGGYNNQATGRNATIAGGSNNVASGTWSSVGGGLNNQATNNNACVPGGVGNVAGGLSCYAAGLNAQALNDHSFVWGDGSAPTISTANDQFMLRASGGAVIYSGIDTSVGVSLPAGSGTWTSLSDRNAKENISAVKPQEALAKVAAMPVSQWSYKTERGVKHIGPMAQDFYAAFNLGADDRHITTIDESGVALAAIQGLNQKLDQRDGEIQALKKQNELLQQRLDQLQQSVEALGSRN